MTLTTRAPIGGEATSVEAWNDFVIALVVDDDAVAVAVAVAVIVVMICPVSPSPPGAERPPAR